MARLWKINCMENQWPGMWQRWFKNQCVAIGWPPPAYSSTPGVGYQSRSWTRAWNAAVSIEVGDNVAVALKGHKLGRIGQVIDKQLDDRAWNPLVPPDSYLPNGEIGRRILVRWDLQNAPDNLNRIVQLPPPTRLNTGELRPAISEIQSQSLDTLRSVASDPANWVGLMSTFNYERSLSEFIASYPSKLEDGLLPYPNAAVRERSFPDRSRSDVLLVDRSGLPVVVECKQNMPTTDAVDQLKHYMGYVSEETGHNVRGILVHGGAPTLTPELRDRLRKERSVQAMSYRLDVRFTTCR